MRWWTIPLAVVSVALVTLVRVGVAAAQDRATDTEIFAAYCQGVMEKWQTPPRTSCPQPELRAFCAAIISKEKTEAAQYASQSVRLGQYLKGQGYDAGRSLVAREAVSAARNVGLSDGAECSSDGSLPMSESAAEYCKPKCGAAGDAADTSEQCNKCRNDLSPRPPFSCRLAQRCNDDVSRLPY